MAAVAIPRFSGVQKNAANKSNAANIQTLVSAAQLAVAQEGAPTADVTWTALDSASGGKYKASDYLSTWPTVPTNTDTNSAPAAAFTAGDTKYTLTITAGTGAVTIDTIP